jgi:hypothetical protein
VLKDEGSRQTFGTRIVRRADLARADALLGPDAVLQPFLTQHEDLEVLSPRCVAPLRVMTVRDGSDVRALTVGLRVPMAGQETAGFADTVSLIVRLDGTIHPVGADMHWKLHRQHPRSGVVFEGRTVPHLDRAVDLARDMHALLPQLGLIAWDLGIDRTGRPWVLEYNTKYPTMSVYEALAGPAFTGERWEALQGPDEPRRSSRQGFSARE